MRATSEKTCHEQNFPVFGAVSDLVSIGCEVWVAKLEDLDYHDQSNDVPGGTHHD